MKKNERFIFSAILFMSIFLIRDSSINYLQILKNIVLIVTILLFQFYEKCFHHKDQLNTNFKNVFLFCDKIFTPILRAINKVIKPLQVGSNTQLTFGSFVFIFLLLIGIIIKLN
jgi:hypothetical protein